MSQECILVVDDSREMVDYLTKDVLPSFDYTTIFAYDGQTGLALIRKKQPDLIMLDFNLPEMTGIDVLQQMARESISIPVILMTGYGSELSAIKAFRLGAKDYLIKPFTIDEVEETIDRSLVETRLLHDKAKLVEQLRRVKVEMSRQTSEMNTLFNIGKALTSLLSVTKVLERVLEAAIYLTKAEASTIWLLDENGSELRIYDHNGRLASSHSIAQSAKIDTPVSEVFRTGRPLRQSGPSGKGLKIKTGFFAHALLYTPLKLRGKTVGVLGVNNHSILQSFSKRDEFLLSFLADYAAIALENARVFQETDRALANRLEELNTLIEITRTITSSLDLDEVIQLTINQVHASWNIEASSLWLLDENTQTLRVLANVGTAPEILETLEISSSEGIVGHVVTTEKWIYTNDVETNRLHYRQVDDMTGFDTRSILCVPLISSGKVIGALQLLNKIDADFDEQDIERALAIAAAIAIAVANALLFDKAEFGKQQLEAIKDHFVATVSHDLRTPLNTISGFASSLVDIGPLNKQQTMFVERIAKATDQMMNLVNDLLELARINIQYKSMQQQCDISEIVKDANYEFQSIATARNILLLFKVDDNLPLILGDPIQLRRAISNLIDNAIKYSLDGKKIVITVVHKSSQVVISVCDQGLGIQKEDLPFIFEKFYRGRNLDQENIGAGLGLAIVKMVTELHGGQVYAQQCKNAGAEFILQLPSIGKIIDNQHI